MRWLETLAIGIFVYEVTTSALLVALMTIARQLPLALLAVSLGLSPNGLIEAAFNAWFHVMTVSVSCLAVSLTSLSWKYGT